MHWVVIPKGDKYCIVWQKENGDTYGDLIFCSYNLPDLDKLVNAHNKAIDFVKEQLENV